MGNNRLSIIYYRGNEKRYGMIYVDRDNEGNGSMKRLCKDSYYWYKGVIESNGSKIR